MIITFVYGAMKSGKTTRLLSSLVFCKRYGFQFHVIKPFVDTRFGDKVIQSHTGDKYEKEENIYILGKDRLPKKEETKAKFIFVDEAQFLSKDEVDLIIKTYEDSVPFVLFYGLLEDYAGERFPISDYLMEISDITEEQYAVCEICGEPANKTQRLIEGQPAPFGPKILLGASELYQARCPDCYVHPSEATDYWLQS